VVKYLGFIPLCPLESAIDLAKPKYLAISSKGSRCRLEEIGVAELKYPFTLPSMVVTEK